MQTKKTCKSTTYKCTEQSEQCTVTDKNDKCLKKVKVCNKWDNVCDEEGHEVCVKYEDQEIKDKCLQYEFTCDKEVEYDLE